MKQKDFRKSIKCRVLWSQKQSELLEKRKKYLKAQEGYKIVEKYVLKEMFKGNSFESAIKRVMDESIGMRKLCPQLNDPDTHRLIAKFLREQYYTRNYPVKKGQKGLENINTR